MMMGEKSLKDLFHLVKQVLPETQELITLSPSTPVAKALKKMRNYNISQIPIVEAETVIGVFSYRSLAKGIQKLPEKEKNPLSLPVEEFVEDLKFASISDELGSLLGELDLKDAVLVGTEDNIQGIITVSDALNYFYRVSTPYILLRGIELAIRELIRNSVTEAELKDCIDKSLKEHYKDLKRELPQTIDELTFQDYVTILRFRGTWDKFQVAFGENINIVHTKLEPLPKLRNDIFHFRRDITIEEYDRLRDVRDWLLRRIKRFEAKTKEKV